MRTLRSATPTKTLGEANQRVRAAALDAAGVTAGNPDAGRLAAVRALLARFDWRVSDRQLALEEINRLVTAGPDPVPAARPGGLNDGQRAGPGQAIADAIQYRDLCDDQANDLDKTDAYLALAEMLGIEVDR
ncbi:MAG: hypothetical protein ACR2FU_12670 [Streptosporangiaceae bacterium]